MATYNDKVLKGDQLLVYTSKVKEAIGKKQNVIDANNKLSYEYLSGTPTIPTDNKSLTNGAGYQTATQVNSAIETALENQNATIMEDVEAKGYQTADQVQTLINSQNHTTMEAVEAKGYMTTTDATSLINSKISGTMRGFKIIKTAQDKLNAINSLTPTNLNAKYFIYLIPKNSNTEMMTNSYEEWAIIQIDQQATTAYDEGVKNVYFSKDDPGGAHTEYYVWERIGDTQFSINYLSNAEISQIWTDAT